MTAGRPRLEVGTHGNIAVKQQPSGNFQARVRVRDLDGRIRQANANGRSKAEAMRRLRSALKERLTKGRATGRSGTLLVDLAESWIADRAERQRISAGTARAYRSAMRAITPLIGGLQLTEASPVMLSQAVDQLTERAPTQARQALIVLRGALDSAVRMELTATNPARALEPVPKRRKEVATLTPEQERLLRDLARNHRRLINERTGQPWPGPRPTMLLPDLVEVLLGTGLRIGEALTLRWRDVALDMRVPTITVTGTLVGEGGVHRQEWPKTQAGYRTIAIPQAVVDVLARRLREGSPRHEQIFATGTGTWVTPNHLRRLLRSAVAGTELEGTTPHTLRRTVATRIQRTHGYAAAMEQLGHTSVAVTERHYVARQRVHDNRDALDG